MTEGTPLWMKWSGLLAATGVRAWMSTLDYRALFYDQSVDGVYPTDRQRIYVFWHEYILLPFYLRGNCNLTMLLSRHRDADVLYRAAYHMGFECVRGSTFGGASEALLELSRAGKTMHLAITPDGPRGPRRRLAQGAVFLASRMQLPIVPLGLGVDRPWRTPTWDRFAIPRPGSRARAVVGPEIYVAKDSDRAGLEQSRQSVERLLNQLTQEAEDWAESGEQRAGAVPIYRQGLLPSEFRTAKPVLRIAPPDCRGGAGDALGEMRRAAG